MEKQEGITIMEPNYDAMSKEDFIQCIKDLKSDNKYLKRMLTFNALFNACVICGSYDNAAVRARYLLEQHDKAAQEILKDIHYE